MKFEKTLIALAATATLNVAFAQQAEVEKVEIEPVVISATRTPVSLDKVAASVSVLTAEDFNAVQAGRVSDAMKKLPNVEFGGGPRINGEVPTIRGVSGPSITLLVDGARQNDTASPGMKSPLFIDPYFLQQAEVFRGAASSLYGPGGNGGVMSFTTLSARDLLSAGQAYGGGMKLGYGSADESTRSNARIYGANDVVDGMVALGSHGWSAIRQGGGTYLDPNDGEAKTGMVKLGVQPIKDGRIELSHQFYNSDNFQVNNPQATVFRVGTTEVDKPVRQMAHVSQKNTVLKGTLGKVDGAPQVAVTLYQTSLLSENDPSPDLRTSAPNIGTPIAGYTNTKTDTSGISAQGSYLAYVGSVKHKLTAGVDTFLDKQTAKDGLTTSLVTRDGERKVYGLFVQDEVALNSNWSVTPSLRSDQYEATSKDANLPNNSASRLSPKLSLAWKDNAGLTLFGSYGEGFRAPTLVELYQNLNPNTSGTAAFALSNFYPNASLKPEVDKTLEIGSSYTKKSFAKADDQLKLRLALFDSRVTDLIYNSRYYINGTKYWIASATPATDASNKAQCDNTNLKCNWQYQNIANAQRTGGEALLSYGLNRWQFNAAYSRVRVQDNTHNLNLFSPPDKLSLQVRNQIQQGLTWAWTTTGVAAQDYDAEVKRRRPGYSIHDVFVGWVPNGKKYRLDFGITNLTDKGYSSYQSANAYAYTYQEGRSYKLALTAEF